MAKNRDEILGRLLENRGRYISGGSLSSDLKISRTAVWKQVSELRKKGYLISAIPNQGYRLEREPVLLDSEKLRGSSIFYYQSVDSTNLIARRHAEEGAPGYSIVVAEEQEKGRGRLGRSWFSPRASGLWFSMILRPHMLTPANAGPVTLVAAAILANHFAGQYGLPLKIKWPNDLLIRGKKVGGILTELRGELDLVEYLVVGIGINVNQEQEEFPKDLRKISTSLSIESGEIYNRTDLLLSLRDSLVRGFNRFFTDGFAPFYMPWKKYNVTLGQKVTLSWQGGLLQGKALQLTLNGALQIQDNRGEIHTINYGELI